jgi:hypothetical protein
VLALPGGEQNNMEQTLDCSFSFSRGEKKEDRALLPFGGLGSPSPEGSGAPPPFVAAAARYARPAAAAAPPSCTVGEEGKPRSLSFSLQMKEEELELQKTPSPGAFKLWINNTAGVAGAQQQQEQEHQHHQHEQPPQHRQQHHQQQQLSKHGYGTQGEEMPPGFWVVGGGGGGGGEGGGVRVGSAVGGGVHGRGGMAPPRTTRGPPPGGEQHGREHTEAPPLQIRNLSPNTDHHGRALHVELYRPTSSSTDWLKYLSATDKAEFGMCRPMRRPSLSICIATPRTLRVLRTLRGSRRGGAVQVESS